MHFEVSPLIVWIALWIVKTYSEFQVNIFSNIRDITKCQSFCTTLKSQPMTTMMPRLWQYLGFSLKTAQLIIINPFPNKPLFLRICSTSLLKTLWEKEKLLVTSNFSFSHSVFYPFGKLSGILIEVKIVVCKLFQFGRI